MNNDLLVEESDSLINLYIHLLGEPNLNETQRRLLISLANVIMARADFMAEIWRQSKEKINETLPGP